MATNGDLNLETFCPAFSCDGLGDDHELCLDDGLETLTANGGIAQGAKISVFDVISDDSLVVFAFQAENGLWDAVESTGCKVHSNSWGTTESTCETDVFTVAYDGYMYEVGLSDHASPIFNTPCTWKCFALVQLLLGLPRTPSVFVVFS